MWTTHTIQDKYKIIFLDIDGVLNGAHSKSSCDGCVGIDTAKINRLAKIVAATNAEIVLTTTWKDYYELGAYKQTHPVGKYLNNKLRKAGLRVHGVIPTAPWSKRGAAILKWLDTHSAHCSLTNFVILDDELFDYERWGLDKHLIKTIWDNDNPEIEGLTDYLVYAAIDILNGVRRGPIIDEKFKQQIRGV